MDEDVLRIEREQAVATLTLNRPRAMNALSRALRRALVDAFVALEKDGETEVVILTGEGRAFCAGLDLKELAAPLAGPGEPAAEGDAVGAIERFDRPVIGAINGFAVTGGFELALACDVLVASTEARFADTHARVGIVPGWGLSQKLSRVIGIYRAKELSLTGNYLTAAQAADWGLVNRVVPPGELLPTCRTLARDMLSCDPATARAYRHLIDDGYAVTYGEGRRLESRVAMDQAQHVTPEKIAERRRKVIERGRSQSGF